MKKYDLARSFFILITQLLTVIFLFLKLFARMKNESAREYANKARTRSLLHPPPGVPTFQLGSDMSLQRTCVISTASMATTGLRLRESRDSCQLLLLLIQNS